MGEAPDGGAPDPIEFDVAARRSVEEVDAAQRAQHPRVANLKRTFVKTIPALLALVLIATAAAAVTRLPELPPPPQTPPQSVPQVAGGVSPEIEVEPLPRPEIETRAAAGKNKRADRRKGSRKVTFAIGKNGGSRPSATTQAFSIAESSQQGSQPKAGQTNKAKEKQPPSKPRPTLLLRRLHKGENGDHYHSVKDADLNAKKTSGYLFEEAIGYLYPERVPGTRLLTIDEGVMGWLYEADQGTKTIPLYRLKGPEYHDFEVIFTSSETEKEEWIGNGWRLERVEGYVVAP